MAAGIGIFRPIGKGCKIIPIGLRRGAGIAHIMDDDVSDILQFFAPAGKTVHLDDLHVHPFRDFHQTQLSHPHCAQLRQKSQDQPACQGQNRQSQKGMSLLSLSGHMRPSLPFVVYGVIVSQRFLGSLFQEIKNSLFFKAADLRNLKSAV